MNELAQKPAGARIKAVIFDLDDTLYDCANTLVEAARRRAASAMVRVGFPGTEKAAYEKQAGLQKKFGPKISVFDAMCEGANLNQELSKRIVDAALAAYNAEEVGKIRLFPDVKQTLKKLKERGIKLILVTSGNPARQKRKIKILKIGRLFGLILIHDINKETPKEGFLKKPMQKFNLKPDEILSVGDRPFSEIKISNRLGYRTAQFLFGRFKSIPAKSDLEEPDYRISRISELLRIIDEIGEGGGLLPKDKKIVVIGGGTGLPNVLQGLKKYTRNLTAIVTVTDNGRSSGILRKELQILPPGDIRNCLVALADSDKLMNDLFQYRFAEGRGLAGHTLGNLFIAALTKITGSFEKAIEEAGEILAIRGKVIPSTLEDVQICAELENGKIARGEVNVRRPCKAQIKRVFLDKKNIKAAKGAVEAIENSDLIVIGPGSLHSSIIPNLLIKQIAQAMRKSPAKKVYVCNIVTQPGLTDNYDAAAHVREIIRYLGKGALDYAIINSSRPSRAVMKKYEKDNAFLVEFSKEEIERTGVKPVIADLLEKREKRKPLWEKMYWLRHDADKLAKVLVNIANGAKYN